MKYLFKHALLIEKHHFSLGVHEVAEIVENHPHFLKYINAGWICDPEGVQEVSKLTHAERSERLLEKLMSKKPAATKIPGSGTGETGIKSPYPEPEVLAAEAPKEEKKEEKKFKKSRS